MTPAALRNMGERIVEIKARKKSELTDADYADMRWRKSLMNWGRDLLK
jgi:hypothetical protein